MNNFGLLRRTMNISQEALAAKLSIHPAVVSRLERGWYTRCPGAGLDKRLKRVFGSEWTFEALMEPVEAPRAPQSILKSIR